MTTNLFFKKLQRMGNSPVEGIHYENATKSIWIYSAKIIQ